MFRTALSTAAACAALLLASAEAAPMLFEFTAAGFDGNGVVTGSFVAEDLDGNGQIDAFQGEVFDASATYSGGAFVDALTFGFADLFGLVYDLDGTIGDGVAGAIEGIGFSNAGGEFFAGPGPFALCDGQAVCSIVTDFLFDDTSVEAVTVSEGMAVDAVPLPGALALFAPVLLGAAAMRRAKSSL